MNKNSHRLPPLTALKTFEVVARHQQLKTAANELFVTTSAVSRQIKQLEEFLGVDLFDRSKRSIELNDAGTYYAGELKKIFDHVYQATQQVMSKNERNTLHIRTSMMSFTQRWLMPRLFQFQQDNPSLDIQLTSSSVINESDFDRNPVDIGLTREPFDEAHFVCEPIMQEQLIVVCSPALQSKHPIGKVTDLADHRLITTTSRPKLWSTYFHEEGSGDIKINTHTQLAHFFLAIEAAVASLEVALVPLPLVTNDIDSGRLVAPLARALPSGEHYYAVYKYKSNTEHNVQKFVTWLKVQTDQVN